MFCLGAKPNVHSNGSQGSRNARYWCTCAEASGPRLRRWRWLRRLHKLLLVDRHILLRLFHLDGEAAARPRNGPAERSLYPTEVAVICVIDLRGVAPQS